MRRTGFLAIAALLTVAAAAAFKPAPPAPTRQLIVVYLGTVGTDSESGTIESMHRIRLGLAAQASTGGYRVTVRGVSLEPGIEAGLTHLHLFGSGMFDEMSLGGNWSNSDAVRYLGPTWTHTSGIPQAVLLERDVRGNGVELDFGPERELARFKGTKEIAEWAQKGAPVPPR